MKDYRTDEKDRYERTLERTVTVDEGGDPRHHAIGGVRVGRGASSRVGGRARRGASSEECPWLRLGRDCLANRVSYGGISCPLLIMV
jgi:hypothetical protein